MATRKQRKRREKEQRHEYVWIDGEGNELASEESPTKASSGASAPPRVGREPQAPSWRKSFKRGLIFAPIMLATVMLLSNDLSFAQQVTQTLFIVSIFIPFSFFLDRMMYRSFQKRLARSRTTGRKPGS